MSERCLARYRGAASSCVREAGHGFSRHFDREGNVWWERPEPPEPPECEPRQPCPSCVGMAEATVDNAGRPLAPVQDGGFWDGFRYAQKALRDLRLASETASQGDPVDNAESGVSDG